MKPRWGLGRLPATVGRPRAYFEKRDILVDCRGPVEIDRTARLGFGVVILTESHDVSRGPGRMGPVVPYGVRIGPGAWIGSGVLLAGCEIGAGAIVAAGSVVRVIARWDGERWVYLPVEVSGYTRELR